MHEGYLYVYVYVYKPSRTRRSSGSSATYYSVVRANTRRFEEFDDNDVTGTVVRRDGHGRGRGLDEHVRIVAYGDGRVRVRRVGQRIQREHGRELLRRVPSYYDAVASYYDADMYDVSYYLFGSYLSDETETDSKVGNTVAYSDMSGSLSGSL